MFGRVIMLKMLSSTRKISRTRSKWLINVSFQFFDDHWWMLGLSDHWNKLLPIPVQNRHYLAYKIYSLVILGDYVSCMQTHQSRLNYIFSSLLNMAFVHLSPNGMCCLFHCNLYYVVSSIVIELYLTVFNVAWF